MADFKINHPKHKEKIKLQKPGVIVASGRADESLAHISGVCEFTDPHVPAIPPIPGRTIGVFAGKGNKGDAKHRRWLIAFSLPLFGNYKLTVNAIEQDCKAVSKSDTFELVKSTGLIIERIKISDPPSDSTIDSNDFTPYGELTFPLTSIVLTDSDSNTINTLFEFDDPNDLQFWCAQFDVLTPGRVYNLHVEDTMGEVDNATNLTAG